MRVFELNPSVVMCSGNLCGYFNVTNDNWGFLYKDYYIYPKCEGMYYQLLINRPNFAACIYKTEYYNKLAYKHARYGKLHDIVFLMEMNQLGDVAFIIGEVLRWRQSTFNDSSVFSNGPFPNEVTKLINDIYKIDGSKHILKKPLLWNFAYFLYNWSKLKKYMTWYEFKRSLAQPEGPFFAFEMKFFSVKIVMDFINRFIVKESGRTRKRIYRQFESN